MRMHIKTIQTNNTNFILDVGMEKNRNKNWDGEGICITHSLHGTVPTFCSCPARVLLCPRILLRI